MKKHLFSFSFLFFVLLAAGAMAQDAVAKFKWDSPEYDFGKIPKDIPVSHEFNFTNAGKETLIITDAKASCGCTTPTWTKSPIPPGGSGMVKATFNATTMGMFNKSVTVTANVEGGTSILIIKGEVLEKSEVKGPTIPAGNSVAEEKNAGKNETAKAVKRSEGGVKSTGKTAKKETKK